MIITWKKKVNTKFLIQKRQRERERELDKYTLKTLASVKLHATEIYNKMKEEYRYQCHPMEAAKCCQSCNLRFQCLGAYKNGQESILVSTKPTERSIPNNNCYCCGSWWGVAGDSGANVKCKPCRSPDCRMNAISLAAKVAASWVFQLKITCQMQITTEEW